MLDIVMHNVLTFLLVNPPLLACERRSCCSRLSDWLHTGSIQFDKSGRKRQWRRYANGISIIFSNSTFVFLSFSSYHVNLLFCTFLDIYSTFAVLRIRSFPIMSSLVIPHINFNIQISTMSNFISCVFFTANDSAM